VDKDKFNVLDLFIYMLVCTMWFGPILMLILVFTLS